MPKAIILDDPQTEFQRIFSQFLLHLTLYEKLGCLNISCENHCSSVLGQHKLGYL